MLTLTIPLTVGSVVKYHGSITEEHGLYTVSEISPARFDDGVRLVLRQGEFVLSNVRPASVSVPSATDVERRPSIATIREWRRKDYEAGKAEGRAAAFIGARA